MGFAETMRILSNVNCGLASLNTYLDQRLNGVPARGAAMNLIGNLGNGFMRNEMAYGMQRYGNPAGNIINMYSGYGNPVSNTIGTLGIMSAFNPWMFFRQPCCMFTPPSMGMYAGMGMGFGSYTITTYHGYRHNAFCC